MDLENVLISGDKGVVCRQVGEDYLAYSGLTGETVILSQFAYSVLNRVLSDSISYIDLLVTLNQEISDATDLELALKMALIELSKKGFLFIN